MQAFEARNRPNAAFRPARPTAREAVGLISVDGLQLAVAPKIATSHFLYLASASGIFPRIEDQVTEVAPDKSLWEVIAHWFVHSSEKLLHGELAKGYRETSDDLECARGRILPLETADLFYHGKPAIHCEYEDLSEDIHQLICNQLHGPAYEATGVDP